MVGTSYKAPRFYDTPAGDLFTLIAQQNPSRDLVQVIREDGDAPLESFRYTWHEVIQHARIVATDLRLRWARRLENVETRQKISQPREPGSDPVVVGVMATNGYELYVNIIACLLNRWTIMTISLRNSHAVAEHLLRISAASLVLVDQSNLPFTSKMEETLPGLTGLQVAAPGSFTDGIIANGAVVNGADANGTTSSPLTFPNPEQLKKEMDLPVFYLHTSGSSGQPKLVTWSHSYFLAGCRARQRDSNEYIGLPLYVVPPLLHAIGIVCNCMWACAQANLLTFLSSPSPMPPSGATLVRHLPFIQNSVVFVPPSILEELHNLCPEAIDAIAKATRLVIYSGAPLRKSVGDVLATSGMNLVNLYGSTELNKAGTIEVHAPENWEYVRFNPRYNWHFLPVYENSNLRTIVAGPGPEDSPAVINHENPRGFATNDIWEPHPTVPDLWKHIARIGDITVLSNGAKSDNKHIERLLLQDNHILLVIVFGVGRPRNGVLLKPADLSIPASEVLSRIQPTIERANLELPKHSRLMPGLILIAPPDKPFSMTDKGTVRAKETLVMFVREIERAYEVLEDTGTSYQ